MKYFYTLLLCSVFSVVKSQTFLKDFFSINELVSLGEDAIFVASDNRGFELWKSDGTKAGTTLLNPINTLQSISPNGLTKFNGEIYFAANDGFFGQELWKTNGTEQGTYMVKNIHQALNGSSNPSDFIVFNNELYFTATDNFLGGGYQLWKTDGTENGTVKLYDAGGSSISELSVSSNMIYFTLAESILMSYDLINGITEIPSDDYRLKNRLMVVNNVLYYTSYSSNEEDIRLYKLGGNNIPVLLKEFTGYQKLLNMTQVGSSVYFSIAKSQEIGGATDDLWKTDGTADGTVLVKRFGWNPHFFKSNISNFISFKGELYFRSGSALSHHLWKSNGTNAGTVKVGDLSLDASANLVVLDELLYFIAGQKVWSTDGATGAFEKVSDIFVAHQEFEDHFTLKAVGSKLYFKAAFQDKNALYTTESNPILEVRKVNALLRTKDDLYFESKIDSVVKIVLDVKNIGIKALVFSKVEVIGQDFYINDKLGNEFGQVSQESFEQTIKPGETAKLQVLYYPSTKGTKNGTLRLHSTDVNFPLFEVTLTGFSDPDIGESDGQFISLKKHIDFNATNAVIQLDKATIYENNAINSVVGRLYVPENSYDFNYELYSDPNFPDNAYFTINDNTLLAKNSFDFEQKNTYLIAVKAVNTITNAVLNQTLIISVLDTVEAPALEDCGVMENNLSFGLNAVTFLNNTTVIAVGGHGVILKSDDAGATWRKMKNHDNSHMLNVQFVNPTIGYAIGDGLLKTEDGGETWFKLKLTNWSYPDRRQLFFVNEKVGFVFGNDGKIFRTTDGGLYWKQKDFANTNYQSAHFFDENKGFIVGDANVLYSTLNGGDSWEIKQLNIPSLSYNETFSKIFFLNDSIGFIGTGSGKIIRTVDGGMTWNLESSLEYQTKILDLKFLNQTTGYALTEESLYKSTDSGVTWVLENMENYYRGLQNFAFSPDGNRSVVVGNGASCCVGLNPGHIIYTKDSSDDWKTISYLTMGFYPTGSVLINDNFGLVFGDNGGFRSFDGGITWQHLIPPAEKVSKIEIFNDIIYLATQDGLFKSNDFGETWILLNDRNFNNLFFIDEEIIYANSYESVFKSIDSGRHWTHLSSVPENGDNLFFKNENEGYIGGIYGMYKTIDAGLTWAQVPLENVGENLMVVHAVNIGDNLGFAGTSQGLFKTIDGGVTWMQTNKALPPIKFIIPVKGSEWFLVSDDMIFRTVDAGDSWKLVSHGDKLTGVYFANEKLYAIGYKTFIEISRKQSLFRASPIAGPIYVHEQSTVEYNVNDDANANYIWTVSGGNNITYSRNTASVLWNTPGTYTISLTPYDSCETGNVRELTVVVIEKEAAALVINGDNEVLEFSNNHNYFTATNPNMRYHWLAAGHNDFTISNNQMKLQWGKVGLGKVQLIATNTSTGLRQESSLDVNIYANSMPTNNFKVQVIGESCPQSNNGKINITANDAQDYQVTINGVVYNFTTTLSVDNLKPNAYEFCIVNLSTSQEQCYKVELAAAEFILGRTSMESELLLVNMERGTAPYKVFLNGKMAFDTNETSFSLSVQHGDLVSVQSDNVCEGVLQRTINLFKDFIIFPNPTPGDFQIKVPLKQETISVSLYSAQLELISSKDYPVRDGKVQLSMKDQSSGLYLVKVNTETPVLLKLLKL